MPYDLIKGLGQGHGSLKFWNVRKWPISKSISSAGLHAIKKLLVKYDAPRQYLNFNCTDFQYLYLFGVTW